uniref:Uncharacterized protein n=1 Tax=Aegilops tauschii subsp. strangulata TaxID=200361 RepID=A0A453IUT1_AEGTS
FVGCCFLVLFHAGTEEPTLKCEPNCKKRARIAWSYWFKKTLYYQVALLYMLARLITNVSQVAHRVLRHQRSEDERILQSHHSGHHILLQLLGVRGAPGDEVEQPAAQVAADDRGDAVGDLRRGGVPPPEPDAQPHVPAGRGHRRRQRAGHGDHHRAGERAGRRGPQRLRLRLRLPQLPRQDVLRPRALRARVLRRRLQLRRRPRAQHRQQVRHRAHPGLLRRARHRRRLHPQAAGRRRCPCRPQGQGFRRRRRAGSSAPCLNQFPRSVRMRERIWEMLILFQLDLKRKVR